jgi:hypothetical protein
LSGLKRNTVNRYLKLIRECIAKEWKFESPFIGDVEVDESFFEPGEIYEKEVVELVDRQSFVGC